MLKWPTKQHVPVWATTLWCSWPLMYVCTHYQLERLKMYQHDHILFQPYLK